MRYIVMTASATPSANCWGRYGRVAVVELTEEYALLGERPKMISEHARGITRVVATWENRHMGRTPRCAFQRARAEAEMLAAQLNETLAAQEVAS